MTRYLLPIALLGALVVVLGIGLGLNPREVPSPLVDKPLPAFSLPQLLAPTTKLSAETFKESGKPSLLNVWATWCVGCRQEHGLLVEIAEEGEYAIYGLNYKDQFNAALDWLNRFGNPYVASGYDAQGSVGLDLGVYGLPETFIVDRDGIIAFKHIGPLTREIWEHDLKPRLQQLSQ